MTKKQVIQIKKYVMGAYPRMKENELTDAVWFDTLKSEEYYGILQAAKNYIKKGSQFPPTVGELIKGYQIITDRFEDEVLQQMESENYFDDPEDIDLEISLWNKKKRKRKAFMWVHKITTAPEWFIQDYKKYREMLINNKLGTERKMIN